MQQFDEVGLAEIKKNLVNWEMQEGRYGSSVAKRGQRGVGFKTGGWCSDTGIKAMFPNACTCNVLSMLGLMKDPRRHTICLKLPTHSFSTLPMVVREAQFRLTIMDANWVLSTA